jgi:succinate-acetate transporter protein
MVTQPSAPSSSAGHARAANPLPLGFLALAVATFGFAALQLGWVPPSEGSKVALTTLVLTTPLQLLVSVMAFVRGEVAPATGMGILSGTWAGVALSTYVSPPGSTSRALAVGLIASAVCMAVSAVAAMAQPLGTLVMGGAALRFAVTAAYEWQGGRSWERAAGWVGLALAAVAVVAATVIALREVSRPGGTSGASSPP